MTFKGIHRGELFGVAASGNMVRWSGAAFFRMAEGRIAELWVLGDVDSVKRQLGSNASTAF
jgi:predicted ester cyclase